MMNLQTQLAPFHKRGLLLQNPVVIASGTFGYGIDDAKIPEVHSLGAITCKGTTLRPRSGNEQPRTMATASGMLNAIGLQNQAFILSSNSMLQSGQHGSLQSSSTSLARRSKSLSNLQIFSKESME